MAAIELNNLTNQIYFNPKNNLGPEPFPIPFDYFVLNPFDANGILSLNEMNIIIDLKEEWNGNPFIILLPAISSLSSLNFRVNFSCYELPLHIRPVDNLGVSAGNFNDNYDNGALNYYGGTMSWTPMAIDPLTQTKGWWLVENPNPYIAPALAADVPVTLTALTTNDYSTLGTSEGFKQLFSQNSQH